MKHDKSGIILVAVFFVGVSVLLYPLLSQYWNSRTQSSAVANYESLLSSLGDDRYAELFDAADDYNKRLAALDFPLTQHSELTDYYDILDVSGTGIFGYISIDKLGVELPIYHGTSAAVLNVAVGHLEGTSIPVGGDGTHSLLSAHRGLPHARLFTDLDKLELGDTFVIKILDRTITYQVDLIKTVLPHEVSDLAIVGGEDHCMLMTCTPYGINTHRLLVRGSRIENARPRLYVTSDAYLIDPILAAPAVAAPMLFVLLVYLMVRYRKKPSSVKPKEIKK